MNLVLIPPGEFLMGRQPGELGLFQPMVYTKNLRPPSIQVTLTKPYFIGTTEVTQKQWREVVGSEPWKGKTPGEIGDDYPATYTTKSAATILPAFIAKGSVTYRLPTEADGNSPAGREQTQFSSLAIIRVYWVTLHVRRWPRPAA